MVMDRLRSKVRYGIDLGLLGRVNNLVRIKMLVIFEL